MTKAAAFWKEEFYILYAVCRMQLPKGGPCSRNCKIDVRFCRSICIEGLLYAGIPINWIFLDWGLLDFQQNAKDSNSFALAEFGSIQLEYLTLSHRLNASLYANKTEPLLRRLNQLYPDMVSSIHFSPA